MSEDSQRPVSISQRIHFLEKKIYDLETRLSILEGTRQEDVRPPIPASDEASKENQPIASPISVTLISKTFHVADYSLGDAGDRVDFTLLIKSNLRKDVRAFKGSVIIKDLFDQLIMKIGLTSEERIRAGGTTEWKGGIQYNQFFEAHQRLLTVDIKDTSVSFALESVVYTDGTRESFT